MALERGLNASAEANIQPASDRVTNIGYLLSLGAVFWLEMELLFHVGVIWRIARRLWLFKKLSHKSSILILLF